MKVALVSLFDRLRAGYCARWHAHPDLAGSECVDAHAARVAKILLRIYPWCSKALLQAALQHDDGEMGLGDVAGPFKLTNPEIADALDAFEAKNRAALGLADPRLDAFEVDLLALADKMAGLFHVMQVRRDLILAGRFDADIERLRHQLQVFSAKHGEMSAVERARRELQATFGAPVSWPGVPLDATYLTPEDEPEFRSHRALAAEDLAHE